MQNQKIIGYQYGRMNGKIDDRGTAKILNLEEVMKIQRQMDLCMDCDIYFPEVSGDLRAWQEETMLVLH